MTDAAGQRRALLVAVLGFNVEVRQFPEGWRANFYPAGLAHSIVVGSAWEPTPGLAV